MAKVNWKNKEEVNKYYRDYFRKRSSTFKYRKYKNLGSGKTKVCTKCGRVLIQEGTIDWNHISACDIKNASYQCKRCRDRDNDYREKRRYLTTSINGKNVFLKGNKRLKGKRKKCEVCNKIKRLAYHHWDDKNISKAVFVCGYCHIMSEQVDRNLHTKYLKLKEKINLMHS